MSKIIIDMKTGKIIFEEYDDPKEPWSWPSTPKPRLPNDPIGQCPKCGIALYQAMMYFCPNYPCPAGLGGTYM